MSLPSHLRFLRLLGRLLCSHILLCVGVGGGKNGAIVKGKQIICPKNNYYWGLFNGQHFCVRCPSGRSSPGCSDCKADSQAASCKPCGIGKFLAKSSDGECAECPPGKWQSKTGAKLCYRCPQGLYTPLMGQHACYRCRSGEYQPEPGQTICKKCPLCPTGKFGASKGASVAVSDCACTKCPKGQFAPGGYTECFDCKPGRFYSVTLAKQTHCAICPIGFYQPLTGALSCSKCSAGLSTASEEAANASECTNTHSHSIKGKPSCPTGKYIYESRSSKFVDAAIKIGQPRAYYCVKCSSGHFGVAGGVAGPSACVHCPAGYFQRAMGKESCEKCGSNTNSDGQC